MSEEGQEAALGVALADGTGIGGTVVDTGQAVIGLTVGGGGEVGVVVLDTFVTGEDAELVVIRDLEGILDGVGDVGGILQRAGVTDGGGTTVRSHVGRLGQPVVQTDIAVDTGAGDELEVADGLDFNEHIAVRTVAVVLVDMVVHVVGRGDTVLARELLLVDIAVLVQSRIHRDEEEGQTTGSVVGHTVGGGTPVRVLLGVGEAEVQVDTGLEPLERVGLHVGTEGVTVKEVTRGVTLLVVLGSSHHVSHLGAATFDGEVVLVLRIPKIHHVLVPGGVVVVTLAQVGIVDVSLVVDTGAHPEVHQFGAAHHALIERGVGEGGNTPLATVGDGSLGVVGTALGGDVDDTVRSTGTVDGGRGRILQDADALDIVRVHVHHSGAGGRNTVDHVERSRAGLEGADTVEGHAHRVITCDTGIGQDGQTGHLALELVEGGGRRGVLDGLGVHGRNGTHDGADLLGGTIAHGDGLLKDLSVVLEDEVDDRSSVDGSRSLLVADGGNHQRAIGRDGKRIGSVRERSRTHGSASLEHDSRTGNRVAITVRNGTGHPDVLCKRGACDQNHQRCDHKLYFFHKH